MKVRILKVETDELVPAVIIDGQRFSLPSIQKGWKFNFDKHSKRLPNSSTYALVAEETPHIIEGCMIFQMLEKTIPYMAYLEIAPHNRIDPRKYDHVAGCLIAYAFRESVKKGKGDFKAQLFFDVSEEDEEAREKLINIYRNKYGAMFLGGSSLVIIDNHGYQLEEKYLQQRSDKDEDII